MAPALSDAPIHYSSSRKPSRTSRLSLSIRHVWSSLVTWLHGHESFDENPRLCSRCKIFDNTERIFDFRLVSKPDFVPLDANLLKENCIICRNIAAALLQKFGVRDQAALAALGMQIHIGAAFLVQPHNEQYIDAHSYLSSNSDHKGPLRCILYVQTHKDSRLPAPKPILSWHFWSTPDVPVQVSLLYKNSQPGLLKAEPWDTPFFDVGLVKNWITTCEHEHVDKCRNNPITLPPGFRLLDVEQHCIVDAHEPLRFVALSYMWNAPLDNKDLQLVRSNLDRLEQPGSIKTTDLPDVIADCMRLCTALGERYLWVDKLCIVQDDNLSKYRQINAMDTIYGMATLTIVSAADGTQMSGLPGVSGRPRRSFVHNNTRNLHAEGGNVGFNLDVTVENSAWNRRGWTFQERILSPRCLFITDFQVYFTCAELVCQEELGVALQNSGYRFTRPSVYYPPNIREMTSISDYWKAVSHYSQREFSFQSDILNAFTGVSNMLSQNLDTRFLFGLPEKKIVQAMLWNHTRRTLRREGVSGIPSWSWASWMGPIEYQVYLMPSISSIGTLIKVRIQDSDKAEGLRSLEVEEEWFGELRNIDKQSFLESKLHDKARHLPIASDSVAVWSRCPQNPWNIDAHEPIEPQYYHLARAYPGALVFNTTVAPLVLKQKEAVKPDIELVPLDLCDDSFRPIGYMEIDLEWTKETIARGERHLFIVLSAGLLAKSYRKDLLIDQVFYERNQNKSPWVLRGLLVERKDGLSRRIGIGYVDTALWHQANPKWETIVLI